MKAMAINEFGGPEVLQLCDVPDPVCEPGDVIIRVKAAGLNPVDTKVRKGAHGERPFPFVLGFDVSGVVHAVGSQVKAFQAGQEVYASPAVTRNGSCAEYVAVDARQVAPKPANIDHVQAAGLPLATITAWEALYSRAAIQAGETVVVHAGGGGVGHIAVQLARLRECRVITTASREDTIGLCHKLGIKEVINHKQTNWVDAVLQATEGRGAPVIMDTVGSNVFDQCLDAIAPSGRLVTIVLNENTRAIPVLFKKNATLHTEFMCAPAYHDYDPSPQGQILRDAAILVEKNQLQVHVSGTFGLSDLAEAHRILESGAAIGKLVVNMAA